MKVGIIGYGVIGSALGKACIAKGLNLAIYDKFQIKHTLFSAILDRDLIFLCVPTPTVGGKQDDSAIEENLMALKDAGYKGTIILRSTLVPGSTENYQMRFPMLHMVHCPEFLTAAFPLEDLFKQKVVLLGSSDIEALGTASDFWREFDPRLTIHVHGNATATEMAKYMSNCYLATKVAFMNEMHQACVKAQVDYDSVLESAVSVGYLTAQHTMVPGPDGKFGFAGMCFIKDTTALIAWAADQGLPAEILNAVTASNKKIRPEAYDGTEATGYKENPAKP